MAFNIGDKVRPRFCALNKDKIGEVVDINQYGFNVVRFSEYNHGTFDYMDLELIKQGTNLLNWLRDDK